MLQTAREKQRKLKYKHLQHEFTLSSLQFLPTLKHSTNTACECVFSFLYVVCKNVCKPRETKKNMYDHNKTYLYHCNNTLTLDHTHPAQLYTHTHAALCANVE